MAMTITETEFAQRTSADHIRHRRFASVKRGYDRDQVREYLQRVADHVEATEEELYRVRSDADAMSRGALSARDDAYAELASRVADVLRSADAHAEETRRTVNDDAERILIEARVEAERIRGDAEARATEARRESEETLDRAKEEAERMLSGLAARRDAILAELQTMRDRLVGVVRRLETTMADPEPVEDEERDTSSGESLLHTGVTTGWEAPSAETIDLLLPEFPSLEEEDEGESGEPASPASR